MEACYKEPVVEEAYTTEEVQMRSQAHKQGQNQTRKSTTVPETTVFGTEKLPRKSKSK